MTRPSFLLTLPSGEKVRCWQDEALDLMADIKQTGNVYLIRDPGAEVYDRVAPDSVEAVVMQRGGARHVDGRGAAAGPSGHA